jgi:polyisoprenoid-binding protein YceI
MKSSHLLAVAAFSAPAAASAAHYEIDAAHSSVQFAVKHMMIATVRGEFSKVRGTVNLDDRDLKRSSIEATIDAGSISTREEKRDAHLRSPDFFDVAKYPSITFRSTEVKKVGKDRYSVTGELSMHGVTKVVVLDVESPSTEARDPFGNTKRGAVATTTLNRKDFGLNWNKALEAGGVLVGDTVKVTLDLELARKAATTTAVQ